MAPGCSRLIPRADHLGSDVRLQGGGRTSGTRFARKCRGGAVMFRSATTIVLALSFGFQPLSAIACVGNCEGDRSKHQQSDAIAHCASQHQDESGPTRGSTEPEHPENGCQHPHTICAVTEPPPSSSAPVSPMEIAELPAADAFLHPTFVRTTTPLQLKSPPGLPRVLVRLRI
jgi:hypothetical protein